jgi:choline-sulfatase
LGADQPSAPNAPRSTPARRSGSPPPGTLAHHTAEHRPYLSAISNWPSAVYYRYWEHDDPEHHAPAHYGVRSEDFKYIVYYNDGLGTPGSSERVLPTEYELFDLRRDPAELHNVVDDPDYAAVRLELEAELGRPQDKYADEPYQGPQTPRLHWST